jgi:hypothetical protein
MRFLLVGIPRRDERLALRIGQPIDRLVHLAAIVIVP